MEGKETPISKYLANLERRKSVFGAHGSPSPSPPGTIFAFPTTLRHPPAGTAMRINFDDTFFTQDEDSILHISPQQDRSGTKRRRTSFIFDESENVDSLQKKISELERLLIQTQNELIDGRASYTKLDQINIDMRRTHNEKIITLERAHEEMRLKCKNATERAESMEKQLLKHQNKDSDRGRDFQALATNQLNRIGQLESTVAGLLKDKEDLSQKLTEDSINHEKEIQTLKLRLEEAEKLASKSSHDSEVAHTQLNDLRTKCQKAESDLNKALEEVSKSEELKAVCEAVRNEQENANSNVFLLQEKLRKFENLFVKEQLAAQNAAKVMQKLKDENDILKSTAQREHILQEQMLAAETEIGGLKAQLRDKAAIEGERNNLRSELKSWITVASKLDITCRTPLAFDSLYRNNQDLLLELTMENSSLKNDKSNSTKLMSSLNVEIGKLKDELKKLYDVRQKLDFNLKKTIRRLNLIVQDRDGQRDLMKSYETEFDGMISEPLKARIAQLESIVAEYEVAIAEDPNHNKVCDECKAHTAVIESLKFELSGIKEEKEKLSETLAEFNSTITEDPTTGLKIVSFGNNPSMLSIEARLKECVSENESLKAKLRRYEEDTMIRAPDEDLLKEKKEVEDKLKVLERKHAILTDSYDFESVQLQSACSKLFGYYVVLTRGADGSPHQFRLQSVYASTSGVEDTFILQEGNSGEMLLMDTPVIAHFQDDIERFLRQECSVPGFLSAVTIAYVQSLHQQSMSNIQDPSETEGFDESGNQTSIQVLNTETLTTHPHLPCTSRREVEVEVEGDDDDDEEDDDDVGEEEGDPASNGEEYDDDEQCEEEDGDDVDDRDDEPEYDDDDDEDVVMLD